MLASLKMKYMTTDASASEGYFERVVHAVGCGEGGFTVGFGGDSHSDVAGEGAAYGSADEADGALRVYFPCEERADYDYEWDQGFVFSVKEGHGPSLDDSGQLVHSRVVYLERAYLAGCHRRVSKRQRSDYSR